MAPRPQPNRARPARGAVALTLVAVAGLVAAVWPSVHAADAAVTVRRFGSTHLAGGLAFAGDVSDDGRFVVFSSTATNLLASDSSAIRDIYRRDLTTGALDLVSVGIDAKPSNSTSQSPVTDATGRFVAFDSSATNLIADDVNSSRDVFLRDMQLGTTVRVSEVGATGGNSTSSAPDISSDGGVVAFLSQASNLVGVDANSTPDVYLWDRVTEGLTVASTTTGTTAGGVIGNGPSSAPSLAPDGAKVAFSSSATNLVAGDTNVRNDIFVANVAGGAPVRANMAQDGVTQGDGPSSAPALANGGTVAFVTTASNLHASKTGTGPDVMLSVGNVTTEVLSVTDDEQVLEFGGGGSAVTIAADANEVGFDADNDEFDPENANGVADVYVRDRTAGTTTPVTGIDGLAIDAASQRPRMNAAGTRITFDTAGRTMPGVDTDLGLGDVFSVTTADNTLSRVTGSEPAGELSLSGSVGGGGTRVAFTSFANDLVPGDQGGPDLFFTTPTGLRRLVSTTGAAIPGMGTTAFLSADGRFVTFAAAGPGVTPNDNSDAISIFRADLVVGALERVDVGGTFASLPAAVAGLSADGQQVAFLTDQFGLVTPDSLLTVDGIVRNMTTASNERVTIAPNGSAMTGLSGLAISSSGRFAAIQTSQNIGSDVDGIDIYLRDRTGATTEQVSVSSTEAQLNGNHTDPQVSSDGRLVAFLSTTTQLGDSSGRANVYMRDRILGTTARVSTPAAGGNLSASVLAFDISDDGRWIGFDTAATNVIAGDTNAQDDVFLVDRATGRVQTAQEVAGIGGVRPGGTIEATLSGDGRHLVVASSDPSFDLPADTNLLQDTIVIDRGPQPDTREPVADFDNDNDTDRVVWRPTDGRWYTHPSGTGVLWGANGDIPVPGDFDGDGDTDRAFWRPSTGRWHVQPDATGVQFGQNGDIPVPGDYDADGDTDMAVFRPSTGTWFVRNGAATQFGTNGDKPVAADYDGDGDTDLAVFRPGTGQWFIRNQSTTTFGLGTDKPVPGDYNGDTVTEIAVFRPSDGRWYSPGLPSVQFGLNGDRPAPGDYDGDGDTDRALHRSSNNTLFVQGQASTVWGAATDVLVMVPPALR